MQTPKLADITAFSEITAAILVIVSLGFIYQELEQNTKSTQDASYQQFLSNLTALDLAEATNPELIQISSIAELSPDGVTEQDWLIFMRLAGARIAQMEYAYISRLNGTMSDVHWAAVEPHLRYVFCLPGYKRYLDSGMEQIFADSLLKFLKSEVYPYCSKLRAIEVPSHIE